MKTKYISFFILILSLTTSLTGCTGGVKDIQISGNQVTITIGKHHLIAEKGQSYTDSFLIIGSFAPAPDSHLDYCSATLRAIPMNKVAELSRKYDDFLHCRAPVVSEAAHSDIPITLIGANSDIESKIRSIVRSSYMRTHPVIKISGVKLEISKHTYQYGGRETLFDAKDMGTHYLVNDIEVIQEDYN